MDKKKKRRKRRAFTPEFKAEAVRLCAVGDLSIVQVAEDLDLTESALRGWVQLAEVDAGNGPPDSLNTAEREELARLRRDNKRLTMERDILKAAATFLRRRANEVRIHRGEGGGLSGSRHVPFARCQRSGFYAWIKRPKPARAKGDAQLAATVAAVHQRSRCTYGSPASTESCLLAGFVLARNELSV